MYHDRTAWRCAFLWAKNMDAAKDIDKEMLPICNLLNYPRTSQRKPEIAFVAVPTHPRGFVFARWL
jgi:hypothetical protein